MNSFRSTLPEHPLTMSPDDLASNARAAAEPVPGSEAIDASLRTALDQSVTLETVRQLAAASRNVIQEVRRLALVDDTIDPQHRASRGYTITEVAKMVGRTTASIRKAEAFLARYGEGKEKWPYQQIK